MPNYLITPNMGLLQPLVGIDPGPDYANNQNASLTTIDQHNHAPGNGVPITPSGLNISTDLPFGGNNATMLRSVRMAVQGSPLSLATDIGCIYVSGVDLWYNDESGNQIQITKAGSVFASSSGISSGTATASFSAGVLVVNAASLTPANIQGGSILLGNNVASSKFLTLSPPSAMASNFSLVLPNIPSVMSIMALDTSGNITAPYTVDNSTIVITSNVIGVNPAYQQIVQPSGVITMYGGASAPTGWLLCDGSAVSRTTYATLFSAIGTAYGIGNGSSTFNIPDMRGMFPRGVTGSSTNDPDTSTRTAINGGNSGNNVGSVQQSAFLNHNHPVVINDITYNSVSNKVGLFTQGDTISGTSTITSGGANSGYSLYETRPINTYVNFIIKT